MTLEDDNVPPVHSQFSEALAIIEMESISNMPKLSVLYCVINSVVAVLYRYIKIAQEKANNEDSIVRRVTSL